MNLLRSDIGYFTRIIKTSRVKRDIYTARIMLRQVLVKPCPINQEKLEAEPALSISAPNIYEECYNCGKEASLIDSEWIKSKLYCEKCMAWFN